jgi:hypothetical protein
LFMTVIRKLARYLPALLAFGFVLAGSWLLLPRDEDSADAEATVQVVVLTRAVASGTSANDVRNASTLRSLPLDAVADGALSSLDDISAGVLAIDHSSGQQLTRSSFARSRVAAVGEDFVVTSVRMPSQNWSGAVRISGDTLDVYALTDAGATLVSRDAVVLDSPPLEDLQPSADAVITLAVRHETLSAVLAAAQDERLWLVGK